MRLSVTSMCPEGGTIEQVTVSSAGVGRRQGENRVAGRSAGLPQSKGVANGQVGVTPQARFKVAT